MRVLVFVVVTVGCGLTAWLVFFQQDSHQQMILLLDEIERRSAKENVFLGEVDLPELRKQLPELSGMKRVHAQWKIAEHELRLGQTDKSIDSFKQAIQLFDGVRDKIPADARHRIQAELQFQLAVAYLRKGETANCVHCENGERCILPITSKGQHEFPEGSQRAVEILENLLATDPKMVEAQWLLNIAQMTLGGYPDEIPETLRIDEKHFKSEIPFPRFENVARNVGLDTFGLAGGVVIDDFDGDDFLDVIVSDWDPSADLRYFKNNGDGTFADRSTLANFNGIRGGLNLKQADYDNDGDLDLLVLRGGWMPVASGHPNSLLRNDGHGVFQDVTIECGLGEKHLPTQTADWADFDNDGHLDLFIGNEVAACQLFRNDGSGGFVDVAERMLVTNRGLSKGVAWGDFNNDRRPDLYVSNLNSANRLFVNQGDHFDECAKVNGVSGPTQSFPCWFWDFNNDGRLDIYVAAYEIGVKNFVKDFLGQRHRAETDRLYQGIPGQGLINRFENVAYEHRTNRVTLPMGSNFGDINGDGYLDYYLGSGYTRFEGLMPNFMFLNQSGKRFVDVTMSGGFGHLQKGHGVSFADIDNDGDQDVYIVVGGSYPGDRFRNALFENPGINHPDTGRVPNWLQVKLIGAKSNRSGIGARIQVVIDEPDSTGMPVERSIFRWVNSGGSFGANPLRQQIGLGKADKAKLIEVYWPTSDTTQRFEEVECNRLIEIREGEQRIRTKTLKRFSMTRDSIADRNRASTD